MYKKFIPADQLTEKQHILDQISEIDAITSKTLREKNNDKRSRLSAQLNYIDKLYSAATEYNDSEIDTIITKLANGTYAKLVCSQDTLITPDIIKELDRAGYLINLVPTALCTVLRNIPKPSIEFIRLIDRFENPTHEVNLGIDFSDPNYVKVDQNGARYLVNARIRHPNIRPAKEEMHMNNRNANLYFNQMLMQKKANQSRYGSFRRQLMTFLFYAETINSDAYVKGENAKFENLRAAVDTEAFRIIAYLFRKFPNIPFYTKRSGEIAVVQDGWTTCLIPLCYSLMSFIIEDISGNVLPSAVNAILAKRLRCAEISFDQKSLEQKGEVTKLYKYITSNFGKHTRVVHSDTGTSRYVTYDAIPEIQVQDHEISDAVSEAMKHPWLVDAVTNLSKSHPDDKVNFARKIISTMMIHDNPGIYYKTSVALEYKKSIEPTYRTFSRPTEVTQTVSWNDHTLPYTREPARDSFWYQLETRYHGDLDKYFLPVFPDIPFEKDYVQFLTSKSQGKKADDLGIFAHKAVTPQYEKIQSLSQKRLIHFLLTKHKMMDEMYLYGANSEVSSSGIREQVDRRMRVIEIIGNAPQLASLIILKAFDEIKINRKEIKVGEKSGNILGMSNRLIAGGHPDQLFYFFDVAGMDASTQIDLAVFTAGSIAKWMRPYAKSDSYFGYHQKICDVHNMLNGTVDKVTLSSYEQALLIMSATATGRQFIYSDPVFGSKININPTFFPSGRADTSAQHSLVLTYVDDIVRDFKSNHDLLIEPENFGDDAVKIIRSKHGAVTQAQLYRLIDQYTDVLKVFGYQIEHEASRFYSDFLQLMTLTSVTMPKTARISLICDEHNDTSSRGVTDQFMIVRNLVGEKAARCHLPPNCTVYLRAMWQVMRFMPSAIPPTTIKRVDECIKWPYFIFPFTTQFFPPFNIPSPPLKVDTRIVPRSSWLSIIGDSKLVWLWNQIVTHQDLRELDSQVSFGTKVGSLDPGVRFAEKLAKYDLLLPFLLAKFSPDSQRVRTNLSEYDGIIQEFANEISYYYYSQRYTDSQDAAERIRKATGVELPNSITYHGQPMAKVRDLIETLAAEVERRDVIDYRLMNFLKTRANPNRLHASVKRELSRCAIYLIKGEPIVRDTLYFTHPKIPMVPGFVELSDYNKFNMLAGSPMSETSKLSALASSLTYRTNKSQIDLIIKLGLQIKHQGNVGLLSDYFLTLNLPPRDIDTLRQALMEEAPLSVFEYYNTGFQHQHYPSISSSVERFSNYVILTGLRSRAHEALKLVARDYYMSTAHEHEFRVLTPKPTLFHKMQYSSQRVAQMIR
uniref:RNA-directed RNA polymerase N-terminal domain-containing protein n=1 Tax=Shenzhen reo-like virus 3 TaxID=2789381 RepID=A0A7T1GW11_9REOV|nr:hypothetical protein [Shenzhen reo-like virus 3]